MSIDQLETTNDYDQICGDLVKEIESITALRAATWTNHMRVFSHSGVAETGFKVTSPLCPDFHQIILRTKI